AYYVDPSNGTNSVIVSGNVGVGTTGPGFKMDVQGGYINTSTGFCINGDCKTAWNQVQGYFTQTGSVLYPNSTAWNLGIGTTSPGAKLDVNGDILLSSATSKITKATRIVQDGGTVGTTYYVKLYDTTSTESKTLSFKMQAYAGSEYAADVDIFIPAYVHYQDANVNGAQVTTRLGGLTSQDNTFKNIIITGTIGADVDIQVWLQYYVDYAGRRIYITEKPGSEPITWTGITTSAPANIQKTVAFVSGAKNENGIVSTNAGNVGIGTTGPNYRLDVNGTNSTTNFYLTGLASGTAHGAANWFTLGSGTTLAFYDSNGLIYRTGVDMTYLSGGSSHFNVGGSERLTILSSGNVGVGTATPEVKFHVNGPAFVYGEGNGLLLDTSAAANARTGFMKYGGYEGMYVAGNTTVLRLAHRTDSAYVYGGTPTIREDLYINAAGNVGIGTTAPGTNLHVYRGGTYNVDVIRAQDGGHSIGLGVDSAATYWGASIFQDGTKRFTIESNNGILVGGGYQGSNAPADGAVIQGSVGIGTTGPGYKLDVNGTVNMGGFTTANADEWPKVVWLRNTGAGWDEGLIKGSSARGAWGRTGFGIHMEASKHFGFFSSGWDPLVDIEGGSGRMYIKGNVGIGTTGPTGKLNVNQNDSINPVSGSNIGSLNLTHPTSGGMSMITFKSTVNWPSDGGYLAFYDDNNSYNYWGNSGENSALVLGTTNDGQGGASDVVALRSQAAVIADAPSLLVPSGKVGIGTTNPGSYKLDVTGDIHTTGSFVGSVNLSGNNLTGAALVQTQKLLVAADTGSQGLIPAGYSMYVVNDVRVGGNFIGTGADVAEKINSMGVLEAGDVVVAYDNMKIKRSDKAYDRRVVGVISTNPSLIMAEKRDGHLVAMTGTVPAKVVGKVEIGDLLTTSDTAGYAMVCPKATLRGDTSSKPNEVSPRWEIKCEGAIIGKAMEKFSGEKGTINMLVMMK
ncbi:hypothetical protein AUJ73_05180, partial [Candidatus Gottesmanbacteria bacterium CG1_02_37_22]